MHKLDLRCDVNFWHNPPCSESTLWNCSCCDLLESKAASQSSEQYTNSVNHNTSLENTGSLVVAADGPARLKIMQIVTGSRVIGREEWRGYFQVWTPPIFIGRNGSKSKDRRGLNTRQTGKGAGFSGKKKHTHLNICQISDQTVTKRILVVLIWRTESIHTASK